MGDLSKEFDYSDSERARKTCFRIALFILFVSVLNFDAGDLTLFGLKISVSKNNIVSISQIVLFVSSIYLVILSSKYYLNKILNIKKKKILEESRRDRAGFAEYMNYDEMDYPDESDPNEDPYEVEFYERERHRDAQMLAVDNNIEIYSTTLIEAAKNYSLLLLIVIALFIPDILNYVMDVKHFIFGGGWKGLFSC